MTFWILAIVITAIACAALYYASAGRAVNAAPAEGDAIKAHFRQQLLEIDADTASGRLGEAEAQAAKGELAREMLRLSGETQGGAPGGRNARKGILAVSVLAVALLAFGTYSFMGNPHLPAQPLAERVSAQPINLETALAKIEAHLVETPDDLRGWAVIAPVYMQSGRYADAVRAYRRINELAPPSAESETDLGEALMMLNGGKVAGEALALFRSAAARDPGHVRSRFYVAAETTRAGDYPAAIVQWNELLALAKGDEPWVVTARDGLAVAESGGVTGVDPAPTATSAAPPDDAQIQAMVDGLAARLETEGGSIEDWTRLVRSRMVLGDTAAAQAAYDAARKAYPDASVRTELDVLAADNGLVAKDAK